MREFLRHFFLPHTTNNFRAKLLHNTSIFALIITLFVAGFTFKAISGTHPEVLGISYSISEQDLVNATNQARAAQNLSSLSLNSQLDDAARRKAQDMFEKNYWAHFAPDGTSPWSFIRSAGYSYSYAGENLAKGFTNSQDIISAWLASPTHRDNLLSSKYKDVGFAIVEGNLQGEDTVLVVQMFGSPVAAIQATPTPVPQTALPSPAPTIEIASNPEPAVQKVQSLAVVPEKTQKIETKPAFDLNKMSANIGCLVLGVFLIILVVDLIIVNKRNIPRIVGHNMDHIILIIAFAIFMLLEAGGAIK